MKKTFLYRHSRWLAPLVFVSMCVGCISASHATFINSTDRIVNLEISWGMSPDTMYPVPITLKPRQSRRTSVVLTKLFDVQVRDDNGTFLSEHHITITKEYIEIYATKGTGWEIHFLVTENGIYPIPTQYRKNWQDHLDVITSAGSP